MPRQVTAFSNTTVKRMRSLRDKKARRAEGLFLAEGLRILAEARVSGRLPESLAFSAQGAAHPLAAEIIAAAEAWLMTHPSPSKYRFLILPSSSSASSIRTTSPHSGFLSWCAWVAPLRRPR